MSNMGLKFSVALLIASFLVFFPASGVFSKKRPAARRKEEPQKIQKIRKKKGEKQAAKQKPAQKSFWERFVKDRNGSEEKLIQEILVDLRSALNEEDQEKKEELLKSAIGKAKKGTRLHPDSADLHYWLGFGLYEVRRFKETLAAFKKAEKLDPEAGFIADMAFKKGIIYTVLGDYPKAVESYMTAARSPMQSAESLGIIYSNAAECLMGMGRMVDAIRMYERSLTVRPASNSQALWGLAVALDRDEQISKSVQAARAAAKIDPKLESLTGPGVFFVPEGELHYYLGIAYQALGKPEKALVHWKSFLKALPESPWAYRAEDHIKVLENSNQR